MLKEAFSIGWLIKRYIKMRNYTMKQVAGILNINYTTFSGRLVRGDIDAELLFQLANLLEMDLTWMAQLFNKHRAIGLLDKYQMSRMSDDFREGERRAVLSCLDNHIKNNPDSVADVKNELLADCHHQLFYVLDVLLPEEYLIQIEVERNNREKYYCIPINNGYSTPSATRCQRGRTATVQFCEGNEMLKRIIINRKEELGL